MNTTTPVAVSKIARPPVAAAAAIAATCDVFDDSDVPAVVVAPFIGRVGALDKEMGQSRGKRGQFGTYFRANGANIAP